MDNIVNEFVNNIIGSYDKAIQRFENNLEILKKCDDETLDLLHEIELSASKNVCDGFRMYKDIKEVRLRRRIAKDENDVLEEFYHYAKAQNDVKNKLKGIQNNSQKIINNKKLRTYKPKERDDLTIGVLQNNFNNPMEEALRNFKKQNETKKKYKWA